MLKRIFYLVVLLSNWSQLGKKTEKERGRENSIDLFISFILCKHFDISFHEFNTKWILTDIKNIKIFNLKTFKRPRFAIHHNFIVIRII